MREIRLHVESVLQPGELLTLADSAARHASGVLRLRAGARVILFNGDGSEYPSELVTVARDQVRARVLEQREPERESPLRLTLVQGVSRGERMDLTIQKAVELGVATIQPVFCQRSVVRLQGERAERRRAHWQSVAVSACEQSGRTVVPPVAPIVTLETWLDRAPGTGLRLTLSPVGGVVLADLSPPDGQAVLVVGPEGGLDEQESGALKGLGFVALRLGPRVLRTETAALAAVAALQLRFGDLGR